MREIQVPIHTRTDLVTLNSDEPVASKLSLCVFGDPGVGKSRLIVTAPGPIGVIALDRKTRATVDSVWRELYPEKKIYFPKEDLIRHANPMVLAMLPPDCGNKTVKVKIETPDCCAQHYYRWHVNRVKDAVWTMADNKEIRTVAIDSSTQLYEDILYAHYGRAYRISEHRTAYGPPNQEMVDLVNTLDHKHLILTAQAKEEYKGANPTGRDTVKGFREIGFYVTVLAELTRDLKKGDFYLNVRLCQANASLHGDNGTHLLENDDIGFPGLALRVFGEDVDMEEYI